MRYIVQHSVRYIDVFISVVVVVRNEGAPAPVGRRDTGQPANFAEGPVPVIELQRIAHVLVMETQSYVFFERISIARNKEQFLPPIIGGEHVQNEDVRMPVVVDVCHVDAHRRAGDMSDLILYLI